MPDSTRERILDAAERLFAEHGYHGTSLRAITTAARVNLAAVNYHFRTKQALVQQVFERRLEPINRRRLELLDACEATAGVGPLPLDGVLEAFIAPVLLMEKDAGAAAAFKQLIGRMFAEPGDHIERLFAGQLAEVVRRFSTAFRRALPDLPEEELFWRIHFCVGAMSHALAGARFLAIVSRGVCDATDVQATIRRLVSFVRGGLTAPRHGTRRPQARRLPARRPRPQRRSR